MIYNSKTEQGEGTVIATITKKENDFEEIVALLSPFKKMIRKLDIYQDKSGSRCLLAVQLRPRQKNKVVPEFMNMKLPKDIVFYIYGRRQ